MPERREQSKRRSRGRLRAVGVVLAVALAGAVVGDLYDWGTGEIRKVIPLRTDVPDSVAAAGSECGSLGAEGSVNTGWGPERATFSEQAPADRPVMNSLTDNSRMGDERLFFTVKRASNNNPGGWCDSIRATDGEILLFRVYVTNSAGFATPEQREDRHAEGVRLAISIAQQPSSLMQTTAYITATNTDPEAIWSNVEVSADQPFRLDPISSSVTRYSNAARDGGPRGRSLGTDVFEAGGQQLGFEVDDGRLAPDYAEVLYITFKARVSFVSVASN